MSIKIPSSNIYDYNNDIVRNNIILGTDSEQVEIASTSQSLAKISWQPYTFQSQKLLWAEKTNFVSSDLPNTPSITSSWTVYSNDNRLHGATLNISATLDDYIDVDSLTASVSVKYLYAQGYKQDKSFYWGDVKSNGISETLTASFSDAKITQEKKEYQLVPAWGGTVPSFNMSIFRSLPLQAQPSKKVDIDIKLPLGFSSYLGKDSYDSAFITGIDIEIFANTLDFSQRVPVRYGNGSKKITLPSNELSQQETKYNGTNMFKYLSQKVVENYQKGKETATLRVSIGEYYDDKGNLAISTKNKIKQGDKQLIKMCFDIGDEIVPYIFGADGQDHPMSYYSNGNPKIFRVCSTNIFYDGATWQELTSQEV